MIWDEGTGLIVRKEADGSIGYGDSAAETFRYFHLLMVRQFFGYSNEGLAHRSKLDLFKAYQSITSPDGIHLQRAPTEFLPVDWGNPIKDFPSDQTIPVICALGAYGLLDEAKALQNNLGYFWQNGQPILGDGLACFRRAKYQKSNVFLDTFLWPTVLARCGKLPTWDSGLRKIRWGDQRDVADDLNLIHQFFQCEYQGHTYASKAALKYYRKNRIVMGAVEKYYSDEPDKVDIYRPVIERVFR